MPGTDDQMFWQGGFDFHSQYLRREVGFTYMSLSEHGAGVDLVKQPHQRER